MSRLTVYADDDPTSALLATNDIDRIRDVLGDAGVLIERWSAACDITDDSDIDSIIRAYRREIDELIADRGYRTFDVISMHPEHPDKDALRSKFLAEHTHSEDEVRFFVRGRGLFVVHAADRVYSVLCEKDDLISVPADTRHWFDMGGRPRFTAIRLFNNPEGWVASFTGDQIASRFPTLED